jgi:hypothetical protein
MWQLAYFYASTEFYELRVYDERVYLAKDLQENRVFKVPNKKEFEKLIIT